MLTDIHSHHTDSSSHTRLVSCSMPGIGPSLCESARYISLSLHPWYVTAQNLTDQLKWIETSISSPKVLAIGEAGLDKVCATPFVLQLEAFRQVIILSEQYRLPLIIHCVKAYNEIIQIKKETNPLQPWIIHGFRGKKEVMEMLVRHGFYLSFGERYNQQSLQQVPLDSMFVETDESDINITLLYQQMAQTKRLSYQNLFETIQNNVIRLFPTLQSDVTADRGE